MSDDNTKPSTDVHDKAADKSEKEKPPPKSANETDSAQKKNKEPQSPADQLEEVSSSADISKTSAIGRKRRHSSEECCSSSLMSMITAKGESRVKWLSDLEAKYSRMEQELGVDDNASDVVDFAEDSMDSIMEKLDRSEQKIRAWEQKGGFSPPANTEEAEGEAEESEEYMGDDEAVEYEGETDEEAPEEGDKEKGN